MHISCIHTIEYLISGAREIHVSHPSVFFPGPLAAAVAVAGDPTTLPAPHTIFVSTTIDTMNAVDSIVIVTVDSQAMVPLVLPLNFSFLI